MNQTNPTSREAHFEFGANWAEFAKHLTPARVDSAVAGVKKLLPDLQGKTFLDIGSGSGLHSLAALMLGASHVTAIDIDENSVETTRSVLHAAVSADRWTAACVSIFDFRPGQRYDVVYSWGVLHHTGAMWPAIEAAARLAAPGGALSLAIYAKVRSHRFWRVEKAAYAKSPRLIQGTIRGVYTGLLFLRLALTGNDPFKYIADYSWKRGMRWSNDVHDWLGGHPYEAATAEELIARVEALGFKREIIFALPYSLGLFGAGCHEMTFRAIGGDRPPIS